MGRVSVQPARSTCSLGSVVASRLNGIQIGQWRGQGAQRGAAARCRGRYGLGGAAWHRRGRQGSLVVPKAAILAAVGLSNQWQIDPIWTEFGLLWAPRCPLGAKKWQNVAQGTCSPGGLQLGAVGAARDLPGPTICLRGAPDRHFGWQGR